MKKYFLIVSFFSCAVQVAAEESQPLIVRGDRAFPPYEFINDSGVPDGFNIDLTRALLEELGIPYELQLEDWPAVVKQFEDGTVGLITGIAKTADMENRSDLSEPHSLLGYKFICRKDAPVHDPHELSGKNIIVQRDALPHRILEKMHYGNLILVGSSAEGLNKLSQGVGDVAIYPDNTAQYIIYKRGLTNLDIIDSGWSPREYCFVASDPLLLKRINAALLKLKRNGVYEKIHTKWLGSGHANPIPMWVYFLLAALALTAVLLYVFVHVYKRKIRKGELLLKAENEKLNALLVENGMLINRYQTMFNTTLVGFCYYDKNGVLVNINDEMVKFFGMKDKREILNGLVSIYENPFLRGNGIVDEENRIHEFRGLLKYDLRKDHCPEYFARFEPREGIYYCNVNVTPIINPKGEPEGTLLTAMDQTEAVNHDRQMAEQEAKLNLALEAGAIAAWIYDLDTQTFGSLRGETLVGERLDLEENRRMLHPDDRAMLENLFGALARGEKEMGGATFRYLHEDGTYHYYESRMIVKREDDKVTAILGTQKDVTREVLNSKMLRDTVEKLRFAIRTAGMTMWEYDCVSRMFTAYNDPLVDFQDGATLSIDTFDKNFAREGTDWDQVANATRILENRLDEPYSITVKLKTKYDSSWQYCTISGVPMEKDDAGRVVRYLGVRINITEQMKYQHFLEREKEQAQEADKLKSAFLANMSHEIRTPLNAIVGFSELLQTAEDPEERAEYVQIIRSNNELLLRLIGDILDLSKIESGFIELKPEKFDLAPVFDETLAAFKQRCTNPEVELLGSSPYKSCKVYLDRNRLIQVGTNFLTNAIKHTEKGHILMGYEYVDHGIRIYVEDTGCGVPEEKQGKLFQRFAKLDDFTQGTGLGLAICKAIVDAKNGRIGVDSEVGKGSTFWAWFPCEAEIEEAEIPHADSPESEADVSAPTDVLHRDASANVVSKSVLVAEDIDSNFLLVKAILKGFDLTRAKTGREVVALAAAHRYDLILMDMKMPELDGIEATRKIREFDPTTPIVAVTANAFDSAREEALRAGCNAFVAKPITRSDLESLFEK